MPYARRPSVPTSFGALMWLLQLGYQGPGLEFRFFEFFSILIENTEFREISAEI